ncbi:uncharacterized protein LOC120527786 [Polypterus senegalus]|uniref:uncharacterized protein LOC120527786 n=1 Tax=Polypterus senegalus TaxID=55291 RepID=UPI001962FFD0|nr:uncharacterized protein LOC120527786 [Polypterus senegalus]
MSQEDQESSPSKKIKKEGESELKVSNYFSIRISDGFIRTVGNVVTPLVLAHASLQIIRELKGVQLEGAFINILSQFWVGVRQFRPGSIIIDAESLKHSSALNMDAIIQKMITEMKTIMPAGNFVIEKVNDKDHHSPEPKVQAMDLALYTLHMLKKELGRMKLSAIAEVMDFHNAEEMISQSIRETQSSTKVCLLSQNGKGKSFILNLLLLMTADTDEEYQEYIKNNEGILPLTQERLKLLHKKGHTEIIPEIFAEELENAEEEEDSDQKKEKILKMMQNCCYTSSISLNRMAEMMKAEEKSFSALKKYCESDGGNLRDFRSYLLPEKGTKKTHISTTKSVVRLHYGRIYQMKVKYMSKEDLQNQLYELVEIARDFSQRKERGLKESKREESQRLSLEKRFKILTTHFQEGNIDQEALMQIESPDCILLKEEVKTFAGTTAYFIGLGKNATEDRLFIREKLREMITLTNVSEDDKKLQEMKIAAVKDIVVFAPCKLLCGGKELIEMPGTDESDPLAQHEIGNILDKANGTLLLSESSFNIGEADVKDILRESKFLHNFIKSPDEYMLLFMAYQEKNKDMQFTKDAKIIDMEFIKEEEEKNEGEIEGLERLLEKQLPEDAKKSINTSVILPVFHSSLLMQEGDPTEIMGQFESNLQHTGVYKVMEELDQFGFMNLKPQLDDAKVALIHLKEKAMHYEVICKRKASQAEETIRIWKIKEIKDLKIDYFLKEHDKILQHTKSSLNEKRKQFINGKVAKLLKEWGRNASEKWKMSKSKVTNRAVFNPYFNGRHPNYKVKLYNIAYGKPDELEMKDFLNETRDVMVTYKENALKLLEEVLDFKENGWTEMKEFVMQAINHELDEAIVWYMGKKKMPFDEKKLIQLFERSLVDCLKEKLLKYAYSEKITIGNAKEMVTKQISGVVENAAVYFEWNIEKKLHDQRWKSFLGKVNPNSKTPRLLQITMSVLKPMPENLSKEKEETLNVIKRLDNLIKMADVALKGTKKTGDK